jgi:peptide deformylase
MLRIVKDNIPSLRQKSAQVVLPLSKENKALLDEMLQYLKDSQDESYREKHPSCREGVGLAAPQVGHNLRMLVIYYPTRDLPEGAEQTYVAYELVNPRIIVNSVRKCYIEGGEGCLSVDAEHPGNVYRDFKVIVDAYDALTGKQEKITCQCVCFGRLGEVGKNTYCFETERSIILLDAGVRFPEANLPGRRLRDPGLHVFKEQPEQDPGLFITHGHEDHIGGIPFLIRSVYIPSFTPRVSRPP